MDNNDVLGHHPWPRRKAPKTPSSTLFFLKPPQFFKGGGGERRRSDAAWLILVLHLLRRGSSGWLRAWHRALIAKTDAHLGHAVAVARTKNPER